MGIFSGLDLGTIFSGVGSLAKDIRQAITGEISPEKKAELETKLLELEQQAMNGQNQVNLIEAQNTNWFVSGWRPFVGWICGLSLAYVSIIEPLARFISKVGFKYVGDFPIIDVTITLQILLGMLGLSAYRSFEKIKGVNTK